MPLLLRAYQLWRELETSTGASLFTKTGGLMIGPQGSRTVSGSVESARAWGLDYELLDAFHQTFAAGIHAIDADAPVLFEPVSTRNETDDAVIPVSPFGSPGAYAVHIYTGIFSTCLLYTSRCV